MLGKMGFLRIKMALEGLFPQNYEELGLFYKVNYRKVYKYPEGFILI